jgi:hypothetical protein
MDHNPYVRFYRLFPGAPDPRKAPRDVAGFLPHRAVKYCEAVTLASGFGWWLFPPADITVVWSGSDFFASINDGELSPINDVLSFPGWPDDFYASAPEIASQVPPPALLTALPEPGYLQINMGVIARCAPGCGLLIRRPVNFPISGAVEHMEGIINPAVWSGSLFVNVRITKTDTPVRIYADRPFVQVQPVPFALLRGDATACAVDDMGEAEWRDYAASFVEPALRPDRPYGEYAAKSRPDQRGYERRGGCPVSHS